MSESYKGQVNSDEALQKINDYEKLIGSLSIQKKKIEMELLGLRVTRDDILKEMNLEEVAMDEALKLVDSELEKINAELTLFLDTIKSNK